MTAGTLGCPRCGTGVEPLPDGSVICPACDWFGDREDADDE